VGEHRLSDDIAYREDMRDIRALLAVDGDETLFVDRDSGILRADPISVRPATDGDQDSIESTLVLVKIAS
jgi:hypothetical protein